MNQNKRYNIAFILLLLAVVFFALPWHQGFTVGDCGDYLNAANQLLHGNWDIQNNFYANRIGTYLPYAIGMKLFGFGTWLTLITTIEFLLLLSVIYYTVKRYNTSIAFMACSLLGTSAIMLQNASVVMGDMASTLCCNAMVLCYFYFTFYAGQKQTNQKRWGISVAALFFLSFLVKESVVFFLPFMLWQYFKSRKNETQKIFWKYAFGTIVLLVLTLLLAYLIKTGNPFYRIIAVETGPTSSDCNYVNASWLTILNRITWQPFQFLTQNYTFSFLLLLSFLQLFQYRKDASIQEKFFQHYFIFSIAMWWMGSQSLTSYNPVSLVHRIWLPLLVPMAINASFFITALRKGTTTNPIYSVLFIFVFLLFTFWSLFISIGIYANSNIEQTSAFISIAVRDTILGSVVIFSLYKSKLFTTTSIMGYLLFIAIIIFPVKSCLESVLWRYLNFKSKYSLQKEMLDYATSYKPKSILTDYWILKGYPIYLGFDKKFHFVNYTEVDTFSNNTYLLLNKITQFELEKNINETRIFTKAKNKIPDFVLQPTKHGFILIKENETNLLYRYIDHAE